MKGKFMFGKPKSESYPLSPISAFRSVGFKPISDARSCDGDHPPPSSPDSQTPLNTAQIPYSTSQPSTRRRFRFGSRLASRRPPVSTMVSKRPRKPTLRLTLCLVSVEVRFGAYDDLTHRFLPLSRYGEGDPGPSPGRVDVPCFFPNQQSAQYPRRPIPVAVTRTHRYADVFLTTVILVHWAALLSCTWVPGERLQGGGQRTERPVFRWTLVAVFCVYTVEAVARMVVGGVLKDGIRFPNGFPNGFPNERRAVSVGEGQRSDSTRVAYLRRSFNRLDLFCIGCFWLQFALECFGKRDLYFLTALSSLRIFRLLNFAAGSQVILKSLKASVPLLANVATIIGFFILAYSILGTTFFRTSLKTRCYAYDAPTGLDEALMFERFCGSYVEANGTLSSPIFAQTHSSYNGDRLTGGYSCPVGQRCKAQEYENPNGGLTSFDTLPESFIYVFIIGSGQSWYTTLYQLASTTTRGSSVYFVVVNLTLNFWLLNLFVAVITEVFANLRSSQSSAFAGEGAIDLLKSTSHPKADAVGVGQPTAERAPTSEGAHLGRRLAGVVNSSWFERFWVLAVIANMALLASRTSRTSPAGEAALARGELVLSALFVVEILLRYLGAGGRFLARGSNRLDLALASINLVAGVCKLVHADPVYRYLVVFQLLRAYRVMWWIPNVRDLLTKVLGGTAGIVNMVLFVFMVILLCCGIAMQLFGGTIALDDEAAFPRFDSLGWSFLGLYQVFSGEDWSSVLFLTMRGQDGARTVFAAVIFVIVFFGLSNFILLNLFVAVLVENLEISEAAKRRIQLDCYLKGLQTHNRRINAYLSPFNVYRYVEPGPRRLRVSGLPSSLVLPVAEANVKHFLAISQEVVPPKSEPSIWARLGKFNVRKLVALLAPPRLASVPGSDAEADGPPDLPPPRPDDQSADAHLLARDEFYDAHPTYDRTLFLFSRRSRVRRLCQMLAGSEDPPRLPPAPLTLPWLANRLFFWLVVLAVLVNVLTTLTQTPELLSDARVAERFKFADGIFLVIFTVDVGVHVVADGLLLTPNAYLFSTWNVFYFLALVISYVDFFAALQKAEGLSRLARAGKALRVLRLINFSATAKFTLGAVLVSGFWKLFDAASIALGFLVPWAIYLQNVFAGRFYACNDDVAGAAACSGEFVDPDLGITMPRVWANPWKYSFDDFPSALRILFEITSGEGWTDVMKRAMSVTGPGLQPAPFASPLNALLIVTFNFMVSVSIVSLFVSIVIDNFTTRSGSALLALEQRRWKDLYKLLRNVVPPKVRVAPPGNPLVAWLYRLATAKRSWLTAGMAAVHLAILIVLATEREVAGELEIRVKAWLTLMLVGLCAGELAVRGVGLGPRLFFANVWNVLQLLLVSVGGALALAQVGRPADRITHNLLNFVLVLVALRALAMFDGLHQLFQTLRASARPIVNLLFVWVILFFIYATIFIQVFGLTRVGPNEPDRMANFRNPLNALMMLVRFSQGEGWNGVMYDYTVQPPYCVIDNPTLFLASDCGSPAWSYTLFMSFNILSMYIFLNMFAGVVVDHFSYCYQLSEANSSDLLSRNQIRSFKRAWGAFDTHRAGYLKPDRLVPFLLSLAPPFDLGIYDRLYSVKTLVEGCFHLGPGSLRRSHGPIGADEVSSAHLHILNSLLRTMDAQDVARRRRRLNLVYHECLVLSKPGRGIPFTDALLVLARHKLIDPQSAFSVEELVRYSRIRERVNYRLNLEKVVGTLRMLVLRRRFLRHLGRDLGGDPGGDVRRGLGVGESGGASWAAEEPLEASSFEGGSFDHLPGHPTYRDSLLIEEDSEGEGDPATAARHLQELHRTPWPPPPESRVRPQPAKRVTERSAQPAGSPCDPHGTRAVVS
ncbi:hypothetical protein L0F63_007338, partial [Massospora cicadina]